MYLVLRHSVLMKDQQIFLTRFSYIILSRICGKIHMTKQFLITVLIQNRKKVERQDPDNFPCFPTQEMCAMKLAAYVFKPISRGLGIDQVIQKTNITQILKF